MVCWQSSFPDQFGYVPIAERKIQIPTYAAKDDLSFVMSPMEWVIRGDRHGLSFYRTAVGGNLAKEPNLLLLAWRDHVSSSADGEQRIRSRP
jgi:hypothetical protein